MAAPLSPVVVGRAAELAALRAALDAAAAGAGSTILVTGEAGVGKSRLLREVRRWCTERGVDALVGRAVDTATAVPFRPLAEALLAASRAGWLGDDPDIAPFRNALARLVPHESSSGRAGGPDIPLLHVAEGFLRVARSRGRGGRGVAVLLDDLHWADAETLAVVQYLADNVPDEPVLLVLTARHDPTGDAVRALVALADRRVATLLRVLRLTTEQTVEMVRGCLGDAAVPAGALQLVTELADGLPFFVEELLAGLANDGALVRQGGRWIAHGRDRGRPPTTFADSVRRRFASLAPAARRVLLDAAMLGRRIDPALVAAVSDTDPATVDVAVQAAVDRALLVVDDLGVRFRHALTRNALLADLLPGERASRARRALDGVRAALPGLEGELAEVAADLAEVAGEA